MGRAGGRVGGKVRACASGLASGSGSDCTHPERCQPALLGDDQATDSTVAGMGASRQRESRLGQGTPAAFTVANWCGSNMDRPMPRSSTVHRASCSPIPIDRLLLLHVVDTRSPNSRRRHRRPGNRVGCAVPGRTRSDLAIAAIWPAQSCSTDPTRRNKVSYLRKDPVDLLVVGSRGHGLVRDLLFGQTVDRVRHQLSVPMLIARQDEMCWRARPQRRVQPSQHGAGRNPKLLTLSAKARINEAFNSADAQANGITSCRRIAHDEIGQLPPIDLTFLADLECWRFQARFAAVPWPESHPQSISDGHHLLQALEWKLTWMVAVQLCRSLFPDASSGSPGGGFAGRPRRGQVSKLSP